MRKWPGSQAAVTGGGQRGGQDCPVSVFGRGLPAASPSSWRAAAGAVLLGLPIVVAAGDDHQIAGIDAVNQPVAVVDAARPEAGAVLLQRFRFADAGKGITQAIPDLLIDPLQRLALLRLPVGVIFPGGQGPGQA